MTKTTVLLLAALAVGACSKDAVSPADYSNQLDEAAILAYSADFVGDPGANFLPGMAGLPDNLKLTAQQQTQIKALLEAFRQNNKASRDSLAAIMRRAKEAAVAGKTADEVRAIIATGQPYRQALQAAEQKLHDDVWAVLTADQKAWIDAHKPGRCSATPLTDAQKNQISALLAQFAQDNKADLDAIKAAHDQARAAIQSGASKDAVLAILQAVQPAIARVTANHLALEQAIKGVLTPEQLAAHCGLPGGMGKDRMGLPPMGTGMGGR